MLQHFRDVCVPHMTTSACCSWKFAIIDHMRHNAPTEISHDREVICAALLCLATNHQSHQK